MSSSAAPETQEIEREAPGLAAGLAALGTPLPAGAVPRLAALVGLLVKWNRVYNLTAVDQPADIVAKHLLDSLSVEPYLRGPRVLDIGSGAGFPGLPLAMARPDLEFTLLDSREKRVRFLRQTVAELELPNVVAVAARIEHYRQARHYQTLITRAFGSLADLVVAGEPLRAPEGWFLAMKGVYPAEELADPALAAFRVEVKRLAVPGLDAQRHLVLMGTRDD